MSWIVTTRVCVYTYRATKRVSLNSKPKPGEALLMFCSTQANQVHRRCRDKVQVLESQLELAQKKLEAASASKVAAFAKASEAASSNLVKTNQKLRDENADLRDENEELKAMVEVLKARERPGLLFDPSMSPTMSVFM